MARYLQKRLDVVRWLGLAALIIQVNFDDQNLFKYVHGLYCALFPHKSTLENLSPCLCIPWQIAIHTIKVDMEGVYLQVVSILLAYLLSSGQQKLLEHARFHTFQIALPHCNLWPITL